MEQALEEISSELGIELPQVVEHVKGLPKAEEMEDLRARIDCLLKENAELKMQVADRDDKLKEAEALTAATFEEKVRTQEERERAVTMARKVLAFVGYPSDVVTKARLYDESMNKKPEVVPAPKVLPALIDYSGKMEKLFGELCTLLQHGKQREVAGPSERRPEPELVPVSRPEPASIPAAPSTIGAPAPTPQLEVPGARPEVAATPGMADPTLQEPIPDSLNTNDLVSLHQWVTERLREMAMPTTGSQGSTAPVVWTTPGSVTRSQQRGSGSVQANLFGGTRDDPTEGFCQRVRERQFRQEEQVEEILSSSEFEEDPVSDNDNSMEGEDVGPTTSSQENDPNSSPASAHRAVIWSTPKKLISRPKRKAYKSKRSRSKSNSRKQSKGQN